MGKSAINFKALSDIVSAEVFWKWMIPTSWRFGWIILKNDQDTFGEMKPVVE